MSLVGRGRWLPAAWLAAVLSATLAILYVNTRVNDTSYFENVVLLRQLKQLDASWELNVLKSRLGLNASYDSLVDPLVELNQLREQLRKVMAGRDGSDLLDGQPPLDSAIDAKTQLVERFKSNESVLRNSLTFLPTAAEDVHAALARNGVLSSADRQRLMTAVNQVLLMCLIYAEQPSEDGAAAIGRELKRLQTIKGRSGSVAREELDVFSLHVNTVLREQPIVDRLLDDLAAVPTARLIDELHNLLSRDQLYTNLQMQEHKRALLIFATVLAGLLLYAAIGLFRSHAVIKRVNEELLGVNATLEQRVQDRTRELRIAQTELLATARKAGMAEVANNVLHNVGNVLNSVNVAACLVSNRLRDSKIAGLANAVQLLEEHACDLGHFFTRDEKGRLLPGYLSKLAASLEAERNAIVKEIGSLTKSVDHIKDIVASQQAHAGRASFVEPVSMPDLIDEVLRLSADGERDPVNVVKSLVDVPTLLLDKSKLLQILVNLIRNAREAVAAVRDRPCSITVSLNVTDDPDGRCLQVRVIDDGVGIAAADLMRVFNHGFTTRRNGHGFGLHSCVLAAREMGGTLRATSDGPGTGATFTLQLPMQLA